jgi:hypothetical protein
VSGFSSASLGNWGAAESRTYDFQLSLDSSAGDAYQSATTSVVFNWDASAPEPAASGGTGTITTTVQGGPGGAPNLTVSGPGAQSLKTGILSFTTGCDQACTIVGNGNISIAGGGAKTYKLKTVKLSLARRGTAKVIFKLDKKTLKLIKAALGKHRKVTANVTITATGANGHSVSSKRKVLLKK